MSHDRLHIFEHQFDEARAMSAWDANDPTFGRPLAAPLEQCAQLLGVNLAILRTLAPM